MAQARLLKQRDEVRVLLSKRIDEARNIVTTPIRSFEELAAAAAREKQWREYNCELLGRSFSSSDYPYEYDQSQTCRFRKPYPIDSWSAANQNMIAA
jgi:hypothetical protein